MTNNGIQATLIYWYSEFSTISFSKLLRQNAYLLYVTVCKCLVCATMLVDMCPIYIHFEMFVLLMLSSVLEFLNSRSKAFKGYISL